ncbi:hypothetical protein CALVIDRAFT_54532 [Calocera viscosa TUFC12733]|uniref:Protein phosphatase inhibitor 2 (IPP-2) n=1 Tax=Calocera viscosa (strain TUFC12733) TaxID=1330018 RepID=A0A167NVE9_CALVF|nr:hypothetical protein CALVIDRAFT_54532 [Calocera viscosa TUFC12733]
MSMSYPAPEPTLHSPPPAGSAPKPKGILKNALPALPPLQTMPANYTGAHLSWDEQNIAETDMSGENFMKITEPKTPYVRYNAELDEVEGYSNIPDFSLTQRSPMSSVPASPHPGPGAAPPSPGIATRTESHSRSPDRRASFGYSGRPSASASSGSSRSASFSLPGEEAPVAVGEGEWGEVEEGEPLDEEAAKKHAEFVKARGRHYSNEAEAMKLMRIVSQMARMLPEEDDDGDKDEEEEQQAFYPEAEASPAGTNGAADGASSVSTSSSS